MCFLFFFYTCLKWREKWISGGGGEGYDMSLTELLIWSELIGSDQRPGGKCFFFVSRNSNLAMANGQSLSDRTAYDVYFGDLKILGNLLWYLFILDLTPVFTMVNACRNGIFMHLDRTVCCWFEKYQISQRFYYYLFYFSLLCRNSTFRLVPMV